MAPWLGDPGFCNDTLLSDDQVLLRVLLGLRPGCWSGLRCLCPALKEALSPRLVDAALRQLPLLEPGENVCSTLNEFADGSTVVLAAGKHRWSGKLHGRRIRIFGAPGAVVRGRVHLAEGSSGYIYDVAFVNTEGSALRVKSAIWTMSRCSLQCSDPDASLLTSVSSRMILTDCAIAGTDNKPCWVGVLAKGKSIVSLDNCNIGLNVKRGAVAIEEAELCLTDCSIKGCEEIGLRLDGRTQVVAHNTFLECGGAALHAGSSATGSLKLGCCTIDSFETLWGGFHRPVSLDMDSSDIIAIGCNDEDFDVDADFCRDAELAA